MEVSALYEAQQAYVMVKSAAGRVIREEEAAQFLRLFHINPLLHKRRFQLESTRTPSRVSTFRKSLLSSPHAVDPTKQMECSRLRGTQVCCFFAVRVGSDQCLWSADEQK